MLKKLKTARKKVNELEKCSEHLAKEKKELNERVGAGKIQDVLVSET